MRWFVRLTLWTGLASCSGDTGTTFEGPEICDDEIDNNGNGLVDCDDTQYCGGVRCVTTTAGDDDDDTTELPLVEIDYQGGDINFTWAAGGCPVPVKTFIIVNRSTEEEGLVDASCDMLNGNTAALRFQVDGGQVKTFVVDEDLGIEGQMQLDLFFNCDASEQFTTPCRMKAEVAGVIDEVEFNVTGAPL